MMRLKFFPIPFLFGLGVLCIILVILRRRKQSGAYLFFFSVFWVYLLLVVSMVLFPMPIPGFFGSSQWREPVEYILSSINMAPFNYSQYISLGRFYIFIREIAANIVLTIPFGFGINFIAPVRARKIAGLAILVGLGIEISQLAANLILGISYRGVDINDALMNAIGVIFGYVFFRIFAWILVGYTGTDRVYHKGIFAFIYNICLQVPANSTRMAGWEPD